MTDNSDFAKKRFWERYLSVLNTHDINKTAQRYYVIWVEKYIKFHPEKRLQEHREDDVKLFLEDIGRNKAISDWQYLQCIDAVYL